MCGLILRSVIALDFGKPALLTVADQWKIDETLADGPADGPGSELRSSGGDLRVNQTATVALPSIITQARAERNRGTELDGPLVVVQLDLATGAIGAAAELADAERNARGRVTT